MRTKPWIREGGWGEEGRGLAVPMQVILMLFTVRKCWWGSGNKTKRQRLITQSKCKGKYREPVNVLLSLLLPTTHSQLHYRIYSIRFISKTQQHVSKRVSVLIMTYSWVVANNFQSYSLARENTLHREGRCVSVTFL